MLGPALAYLFVDLDKRKDELTEYEMAVHRELLLVMRASGLAMFREAVRQGAADDRGGYATIAKEVTDSFWTKIDLSGGGGWSGDPKLQTNCSYGHCPNKAR